MCTVLHINNQREKKKKEKDQKKEAGVWDNITNSSMP